MGALGWSKWWLITYSTIALVRISVEFAFSGFNLEGLTINWQAFMAIYFAGFAVIWLIDGIWRLLRHFSYRRLLNKRDIQTESFKRWKDEER
ncbi:hypothetical protein [Asticcacaulis machinosus]|uniref:Uncharacterized protein n=1 Tax=Asticcacaulis machinosus TaxID=2984211 RepID=A0ABT5HIF6_9CAUL|nr:hypothetical protein [Asticcacaulis machinosus]MDC7676018.1 hypothetical protein [Asticcacaulis machinosus]